MAYWIDHKGSHGETRQISFFVDSDSDVANLPTELADGQEQEDSVTHRKVARGSRALAIDSGKKYILDSSNNWTEVGAG